METKYDYRKLKVVISPSVASMLCEIGYHIVKMKEKRNIEFDNYNCGYVFLFEETDAFLNDFRELIRKRK